MFECASARKRQKKEANEKKKMYVRIGLIRIFIITFFFLLRPITMQQQEEEKQQLVIIVRPYSV